MKISIKLRLIAGFGVALLLMGVVGAVSFSSTVSLVDSSGKVDHTHEVIGGLERMMSWLKDAETGQRGFVITGEGTYLEPYNFGLANVASELENVRALTSDNPFQQSNLDRIEPLIQLKLEELKATINLRRGVGFEDALSVIASDVGKRIMDELRFQVTIMQDEERRLLEERATATANTSPTAKLTIVVGTIASVGILGIIAFLISRSISTPISRLRAAASKIGHGNLETRVDVSSRDELGELGLSFNSMAVSLQQTTASLETSNHELEQRVDEIEAAKSTLESEIAERKEAETRLEVEIGERTRTEEALRRSNDQNRGLLDAIPDLMFRLSRDGVFLDYKPAKGVELYAPPGVFMGKTLNDVLPQGIAETCIGNGHEALETGQVQAFEYQLPIGDEVRDFEARAAASGKDEVLLIVRDITERLTVDRMKDEFVSVVSHELRTPLTSIRGSLGLIAGGVMGPLPEKAQYMVEIAVNNTDRLIRLINDILDIERMESGKITMERTVWDTGEVMAQAAELMDDLARKAGVTLSVSSESVQVWADPDRIVQTLANLLSNAIKFSPRFGTVWLAARRREDQVLFQVKDQGRGVPADQVESIFERFEQVDASDSREKGGTGLGLAICRSIVQQHGGQIWAESTVGEGSTFFFTLPVLRTIDQEVSVQGTTGPLVLVCDDDQPIREVVAELLLDRGYRVIAVDTARRALEQASALQPSVILLDLMMPDVDGWATMAALKAREDTKDIPVVIFSVLSPAESNLPVEGAAGWIQKPLDEEKLFGTLNRSISNHNVAPRLLLLEDDPELAQGLTAIFERNGIETAYARNAAEAIQLMQQLLPDLLFLGLISPGEDGFAVVDWLRRHELLSQIPLVVYTVMDLDESDRDRLKLGRTEFLSRSLAGPDEIEQRVVELISQIVPKKIEDGRLGTRISPDGRR